MIWATKQVHRDAVPSLSRLFCDQADAFDHGKQMLLVSIDDEWPMVRLWVSVPDLDLLAPYHGFAACRRSGLPVAPILVAGCPHRFGAVFHST